MWKVRLILSVFATLIISRLTEADYYGYSQDQYRQSNAPFKCIEEGYHPDPHDCRIYYRCVDWGNGSPLTTFKFECGVGTVFSKDKGDICTHPEDSGRPECGSSQNELDSNGQNPPSPIWTTTLRTTKWSQPTTMQSLITKPSTITTEATTIKKPVTTLQPPLTDRPANIDEPENNVINCKNEYRCTQEGFLADTCDCRKFYRCVNEGYGQFRKYDFKCGEGTVWDPEIQACNHAWAVTRKNCRQNLESGDNNGQWNGYWQSGPNRTTRRFKCPPGQPGDLNGQPGQPGDPNGQAGSSGSPGSSPGYPGTPNSPGSSSIPGSPAIPDSPNSSANQSSSGLCTAEGFFADSQDCRKFYRCVDNGMSSFTKYDFQCGTGTVWDASLQSCNHAYAVPHCNQANGAATDKPCTSSNEIGSTIGPSDTSKLPSQSSESSIFPSTSSKPEIQSSTQPESTNNPTASSQTSISYLPPSTYSPSTMQVTESVSYVPPATQTTTTSVSYLPPSSTTTNVISGSTSESVSYLPPDGSTATTTLPSSVSTASSPQNGKSECVKEGFFSDPDDCKKFYRCVQAQSGYQKYEFECGPGTAWDQSIQTCNHIEKVTSCSTDSNKIDQNPSTSGSTSGLPATSSSTTTVSSQTITTTSSSSVSISTESTTAASTSSETSTESTTPETDKTESSSTTTVTSTSENPATGRPEEIQMPGSSTTESSLSSESSPTSESPAESSSSTESHAPDCATQKPKPSNGIICNDEGFYPHPTRCDKFYRCVNNGNGFNVYHFDCAPGTIFDSSINVCNYPESVYPAKDCTTGNISSNAETTPSEMPEHSTSMEITTVTQSAAQQTEESTVTSTEPGATTSSMETTSEESATASGTESTTSNMIDSTESMIESTAASTTATTESVTDSSTSEQSSEATTEVNASTESEMSTTETSQEQSTEVQAQSTTTESQEQSTTESKEPSSTEAQEQITTELQEQSTIESQEQTTELSESTTAEPGVAAPCSIGNLTDEQITLVCPSGFRRHPKYCNLFYQCTSEGNMEIKILILSCPENTIFDEKKIQCLSASKSSQPCMGTRTSARFYRRLEDHALSPVKVSSNQLCPQEGHFPYRQGCSNIFYKCKRDTRNSLQGYLYKCPENFVYWSVSRRCERVTRLPMCSHLSYRNKIDWNDRLQVPIEDFNLSARMLRFS
ncbi:PREDICTED: LOW QUALITY PROTEIN: mucin-5AC-like [Wasmannia auropunctata]|uniref:LOW QUALITY PROTEIN: mucin-5AC-like n=1 Tax=Wasmannia auropunctata TaxID=64793 RepID=UPI0005EF8223|nr:PREDICTED: LOW QUALITY PROTEIN: mucin-5AC-like [Wasmannia auropunctata]